MAVIESGVVKMTFSGDGKTTVFPYTFTINAASDMHVALHNNDTGNTTEITTDFYVDTSGKTVHYPGYAPGQEPATAEQPEVLPSNYTITIFRQTSIDQLTDLGSKYPLEGIESMVDKLTMIAQEHDEKIDRSVQTDIGGTETADQLLSRIETAAVSAETAASNAATSQTSSAESAKSAQASNTAAESYAKSAGDSAEAAAKIIATSAVMYDTFMYDVDADVLAPQMYAQPSQKWGVDDCVFPLQVG